MKVCFICDLHLPTDKNALQYSALKWAKEDIIKKKPDCVIFAGDVTCDGNLEVYQEFIEDFVSLEIPFIYIAGNSDLRNPETRDIIKNLSSPCLNVIGDYKIFAVNDCERSISQSDFSALDKADEFSLVFMHHPLESLDNGSREKFLEWKRIHPKTPVFFAHEHRSYSRGYFTSLQCLDPDKSIGESPCITYYDADNKQFRKAYYFCPPPTDIFSYFGVSCYSPERDINFAIDNGLKYLELRPNVVKFDSKTLVDLIKKWREIGGQNLSIHLSEVYYENGKVYADDSYEKLIELAKILKAERVTQHVPVVSVSAVNSNKNVLEDIATFIARCLNGFSYPLTVGVENMHTTSADGVGEDRRFGYTPQELVKFKNLLADRCSHRVGFNFDVGHARNNAPFSQKYQISAWLSMLGKDIVGYHVHQVKVDGGKFINHSAIDNVYGHLISYASIFRSWSEEKIARAPFVFEMREENAYKITLSAFNEYKKRIVDLHSHTYYSCCSQDIPDNVVKTAIANGISVLGINDHNTGILERHEQYKREISALKEKYKDRINILCGIEIATYPHQFDPTLTDKMSGYDYCLIEHLTEDNSVIGKNLFEFCDKCSIVCGIAHTDMFAYCDKYGFDYVEFFTKMAQKGIFWEMNVSYDSVHGYREHSYVKDFILDAKKIEIIKQTGVCVSVGFDGHNHKDYAGDLVWEMTKALKDKGIKTIDCHSKLCSLING